MSPRGGARARSGPKRKLDGRKVCSVSFDEPTLYKLSIWSRRLGLTRSEAIRRIVAETRIPSAPAPKGEGPNGTPKNEDG